MTQEVFGDGHFARSKERPGHHGIECMKIEREWTSTGRKALPQYFSGFGVITAKRHYDAIKAKAKEEARHENQRSPTAAETAGIQILTQVLCDLAPDVMAVFNKRSAIYAVAKTEALLGELREDGAWPSRRVFLAEQVFVAGFAHALAVFLHEHVHIFGRDGSREFTDALTDLLETVVRRRERLDGYELDWMEVRDRIAQEREFTCVGNTVSIHNRLEAMSEADLRALIKRAPSDVLKRITEAA